MGPTISQKPAFVFVPGAWHRPEIWDKVRSELEPNGWRCVSVELPSTTGDITKGFGDDVKAVQDAVRSETSQGNDVIIVDHSYGGHVGSSSVKGFAAKPHDGSPPASDASSHVVGLAMMATGFTITGLTFLEMMAEGLKDPEFVSMFAATGPPPQIWELDSEKGIVTIIVDKQDLFYHDLPKEEAELWISRLTEQSLKALAEGGDYAYSGWKDVPCFYLTTLDDHALPAVAQKFSVKKVQESGADVTEREIKSSHSPMLSMPKNTADFLLEAAAHFATKG